MAPGGWKNDGEHLGSGKGVVTCKTTKGVGLWGEECYPLKRAPRVRLVPKLHLILLSSLCAASTGLQIPSPGLQLCLQLPVDRHFTQMSRWPLKLHCARLNHHPVCTWAPSPWISLLVAPPELPEGLCGLFITQRARGGGAASCTRLTKPPGGRGTFLFTLGP